MVNTSIDLGQLIIAILITLVGFFIKRELNTFTKRLDIHDSILRKLITDTATVIGVLGLAGLLKGHQLHLTDKDDEP